MAQLMLLLHKTEDEILAGVSPAMAARILFLDRVQHSSSKMPTPDDIRNEQGVAGV